MEHRIDLPVLFQAVYLQSPEKFLPAQEIIFQRRYEKAFPETAGTAQKVYRTFLRKRIDHVRIVYIDITVFDYAVKTLYSYRVFHVGQLIINN